MEKTGNFKHFLNPIMLNMELHEHFLYLDQNPKLSK